MATRPCLTIGILNLKRVITGDGILKIIHEIMVQLSYLVGDIEANSRISYEPSKAEFELFSIYRTDSGRFVFWIRDAKSIAEGLVCCPD